MTDTAKKPPLTPVFWESGLEIAPVYTAEDLRASAGASPASAPSPGELEAPGEFPYTRGIHPQMYRKQPWTMRQYSGFGTAAETHARFLYLISQGQTGLNVAFDLPTQCGLDSDDPMAEGEVGRVGMAVDSLADMEVAFADIDLNKTTVSLTINGAAVPIIAMYFAMARKRGFALSALRGTAQNDILKEFIGRGTWIFPVEPSMKLVGDTIEYCARNAPFYSPVSVCGYHIRESGADPAQEMAYGLAIASAYVEDALRRGVGADEVASGITFNFNVHGNIWEQVCKFRAGRRLWAKLVRDKYGAKTPRACQMRMIAGGGGGGLTIQQPENNIVRGAYYALISALSGTQTMALCSFDEAYTIPSERAAKLSLRTMQLLIHEMGLCDTVDPLGGSYFVETMTTRMEERIALLMKELDAAGGIVRAVSEGRVQASVNRAAFERERRVQAGDVKKVGVNCFVEPEEEREVELHPYCEEEARAQIARLERLRRTRDQAAVVAALARVTEDARAGRNVMPSVIDAVETYATVGEVTAALKEVYGGYREPLTF